MAQEATLNQAQLQILDMMCKHPTPILAVYQISVIFVPQIWLSLRPPIFNSRIITDEYALSPVNTEGRAILP